MVMEVGVEYSSPEHSGAYRVQQRGILGRIEEVMRKDKVATNV